MFTQGINSLATGKRCLMTPKRFFDSEGGAFAFTVLDGLRWSPSGGRRLRRSVGPTEGRPTSIQDLWAVREKAEEGERRMAAGDFRVAFELFVAALKTPSRATGAMERSRVAFSRARREFSIQRAGCRRLHYRDQLRPQPFGQQQRGSEIRPSPGPCPADGRRRW